MDGLFLFGKYAFPPNLLDYCGPKNSRVFLEILKDYPKSDLISKNELVKELKQLSLQFEGALPYLKLIAGENNIKNPFDQKVVEAYWLGNNLLKRVKPSALCRHIEERFRKKARPEDWQEMKSLNVLNAAKPFHNHHVFNIFTKVGLMRSGEKKAVLSTMDNCRIGLGRVKAIITNPGGKNNPASALVEYSPLQFNEIGVLKPGEKTLKNFYLIDQLIKKDDEVSLHWNFICDKISPRQKSNLIYWTNYHINIFNFQRESAR